jgi:hypothetical protein
LYGEFTLVEKGEEEIYDFFQQDYFAYPPDIYVVFGNVSSCDKQRAVAIANIDDHSIRPNACISE